MSGLLLTTVDVAVHYSVVSHALLDAKSVFGKRQ